MLFLRIIVNRIKQNIFGIPTYLMPKKKKRKSKSKSKTKTKLNKKKVFVIKNKNTKKKVKQYLKCHAPLFFILFCNEFKVHRVQ